MRRLPVVLLVGGVLFGLLAAWFPGPMDAQGTCPGINRPVTPYAREALAVGESAVGFTVATYTASGAGPVMAVAKVQTGHINYLDDGGTPTSTLGIDAHVGAVLTICGQSIPRFRAFQNGATAATLMTIFYR